MEQGGGKKAKVDAPPASRPMKQEVEMDGGGGGGGGGDASATAMVLVATAEDGSNTTRPRINTSIDEAKLDCPLCTLPLKPPIFQCAAGHLAFSGCRVSAQLSKNKCYLCGLDGSYGRNPALEDIILSVEMPCPYDTYGCRSYVPYCKFEDHRHAYPCAPCLCPEKGCPFVGSPLMLIDHIAAQHSHRRPTVAVRYGQELKLAVTPALRWRALVGQDRSLFVVSLGAIGQVTAVSLVCVRANAGGGAAAQYGCRLGVEFPGGGGEVVVMESKVPSTGLPAEWPALDGGPFLGLFQQLDDDTVALGIRIDLVQPAGAAVGGTTTGRSTPPTPRMRSSSRTQH